MGAAKNIDVKVIPAKLGNDFIRLHHYSGKVAANSKIHFGCFYEGRLHGVLSYGSPMDKRKVLPLVHTSKGVPCKWNEMLELNRMALDDYLPRNSESRCIAITIRLIKKHAPHIRWILSFADGTQCGDGTIYRASGFKLTGIRKNNQTILLPNGEVVTRMTLTLVGGQKRRQVMQMLGIPENGKSSLKPFIEKGCKALEGNQLRYIYLIDKTCRIAVPLLSYDAIEKAGAGMYLGRAKSAAVA